MLFRLKVLYTYSCLPGSGCGEEVSGNFEVMNIFPILIWWWLHNYMFVKTQTVHQKKRVNFIACELYLNKTKRN